uniref:Uncharacterized protein n=1 Tax=Helianthus annuus TaxID=4232 RepID=A0A251URF8_HELAN
MTAALAANFRHSIVTSLLSAIIFSRKVLITDCYRMNRDGYTVCLIEYWWRNWKKHGDCKIKVTSLSPM